MKLIGSVFAAVLVLALALPASAQVITREGSDYDGAANPDGCNILVHADEPSALHVNCKKTDGGVARIRYRFLREPADVSVDWDKHSAGSHASVSWRVPTPRTVRVIVRGYVHINSVTWEQ
jgi:hypothetical protein